MSADRTFAVSLLQSVEECSELIAEARNADEETRTGLLWRATGILWSARNFLSNEIDETAPAQGNGQVPGDPDALDDSAEASEAQAQADAKKNEEAASAAPELAGRLAGITSAAPSHVTREQRRANQAAMVKAERTEQLLDKPASS